MHFGRNYTGIVNKPGMGVGGRSNAGSRRERVAKDLSWSSGLSQRSLALGIFGAPRLPAATALPPDPSLFSFLVFWTPPLAPQRISPLHPRLSRIRGFSSALWKTEAAVAWRSGRPNAPAWLEAAATRAVSVRCRPRPQLAALLGCGWPAAHPTRPPRRPRALQLPQLLGALGSRAPTTPPPA